MFYPYKDWGGGGGRGVFSARVLLFACKFVVEAVSPKFGEFSKNLM